MRPLTEPRYLHELEDDTTGQLATEWALLTGAVIVPLMLLVPTMLAMIKVYFYRGSEVICLPFP